MVALPNLYVPYVPGLDLVAQLREDPRGRWRYMPFRFERIGLCVSVQACWWARAAFRLQDGTVVRYPILEPVETLRADNALSFEVALSRVGAVPLLHGDAAFLKPSEALRLGLLSERLAAAGGGDGGGGGGDDGGGGGDDDGGGGGDDGVALADEAEEEWLEEWEEHGGPGAFVPRAAVERLLRLAWAADEGARRV